MQAVFPDGIVWVKIGKSPADGGLVSEMREAAKSLGGDANGFGTLPSARLLRSLLRDKRALLILDDVWEAEHVYHFQPRDAKFCRVLFTTRSAEAVAAAGAQALALEILTEDQARLLLAKYSGRREEDLPAAAVGILRECRGLALGLATLGALLREKTDQRWQDLLDDVSSPTSKRYVSVPELRISKPEGRDAGERAGSS